MFWWVIRACLTQFKRMMIIALESTRMTSNHLTKIMTKAMYNISSRSIEWKYSFESGRLLSLELFIVSSMIVIAITEILNNIYAMFLCYFALIRLPTLINIWYFYKTIRRKSISWSAVYLFNDYILTGLFSYFHSSLMIMSAFSNNDSNDMISTDLMPNQETVSSINNSFSNETTSLLNNSNDNTESINFMCIMLYVWMIPYWP